MSNLRPFQIVLIGIFAAGAIGGLIYLATYTGVLSTFKPYGDSVIVWGPFEEKEFNVLFGEVERTDKHFNVVEYVPIDPENFDKEFTDAAAEGRSPDIVVLPHESLVRHRAKLLPISYELLPQRNFMDTYVNGAEIFMRSDGIYGFPFAVDPMTLYWNRDVLSSNGVADAPETWQEVMSVVVPRVTKSNTNRYIQQSAIALGEYDNIRYGKYILSTLLLQMGSTFVEENADSYQVTLRERTSVGLPVGDATLSFYTQFASPTHQYYSWNRAFPEDHQQFLAGKLGLYLALGSEYEKIKKENPNLNFDIANMPQEAGATILRTYGNFYAYAIPRTSKNQMGAYAAAKKLSNESFSVQIAEALNLAPVHRNEIARGTGDPYRRVLYNAALIAHGWLDPDPEGSDAVFQQMVKDVTSGISRIAPSVGDAIRRLELLF